MPKNIYKDYNIHPCSILFISGFKNVHLRESITIQMPHPCPSRYPADQVKLMCLKDNQWKEITDQTIYVEHTFIKLRIQHFCG
jgi:hypothetical protein